MKILKLWSMLRLATIMLPVLVACGDEELTKQEGKDLVVTVEENGNVSQGHQFSIIDEVSFYIDEIKYTASEGDLYVSGYHEVLFNGKANIIKTLDYKGRIMNVKYIGNHAFEDCKALTSVYIPSSVTSIGGSAFRNCNNLISASIPKSVTTIGTYAFAFCTGLTSITIHKSVTSIEDNAFMGCSGLTSIVVEEGNPKYDSRNNCNAIIHTSSNILLYGCKKTTIPSSVISIWNEAFCKCSDLVSITIPNSVTNIGSGAFSGCSGLTSVTIPSSVKNIGDKAFSGCSGLTSIIIPNSLRWIGDYAFNSCSSLKDVYCYAESVPATRSYTFSNTPIRNIILHVPATSIDAYKTTVPWSIFKAIVALTDSDPKPAPC